MSIEKKSLISNRSASKKAIVTKPEVTKAVSTRLVPHQKTVSRLAAPVRLKGVRLKGF